LFARAEQQSETGNKNSVHLLFIVICGGVTQQFHFHSLDDYGAKRKQHSLLPSPLWRGVGLPVLPVVRHGGGQGVRTLEKETSERLQKANR
jgi:hypothetical protein